MGSVQVAGIRRMCGAVGWVLSSGGLSHPSADRRLLCRLRNDPRMPLCFAAGLSAGVLLSPPVSACSGRSGALAVPEKAAPRVFLRVYVHVAWNICHRVYI